MKYTLYDLKAIRDSDEILLNRPNKSIKKLILIVTILTITIIGWSLVAIKYDTIEVSGRIKNTVDAKQVIATTGGEIEVARLDDNMKVVEGQELITLKSTVLNQNLELLKKTIADTKLEIEANEKLKVSINKSVNSLDYSNPIEEKYYYQYKQYQLELSNINVDVTKGESIKSDIASTEALKLSILDGRDLTTKDSSYYYEYRVYENKIKSIKEQYKDDNIMNQQLENLKNTTLLEITTRIENLKSEYKNISEKDYDIASAYLMKCSETNQLLQKQLEQSENQLKATEDEIDKTIIKAPKDGVLKIAKNYEKNDSITIGENIGYITPNTNNYEGEIIVSPDTFPLISTGKEVEFQVISSKTNETKYINGVIEEINSTPFFNADNKTYYYVIKCKLNYDEIKDKLADEYKIYDGISIKSKIIVKKSSYFDYFLKMLSLK